MHYVKAKTILSSNNGLNLYRGCQHGCIYCDSRSACYGMEHEFEDIEIKENALSLLEEALRRKRRRCMIGTGSMSDPYMPLEKELLYTRRTLELMELGVTKTRRFRTCWQKDTPDSKPRIITAFRNNE